MARKYHTVLVRDSKTAPWSIHFGDYDRETAKQERDDIVDGGDYTKSNTTIITTSDHQDMINEAVAQLNLVAEPTTKTYRLGSSDFVSAPGLIAWAINGAAFPRDRKAMVNVVAQTWGVPTPAATALLTRKVPFTVEDGTVVFTA